MKAYVKPQVGLSRAMSRVSTALEKFAPSWVEIVDNPKKADFKVLHVIGMEAIDCAKPEEFAVIQYCLSTAGGSWESWRPLWSKANTVWSYYDLYDIMPSEANFYRAPMGIDPVFQSSLPYGQRPIGALTSGYVTGPGAEAIEEVSQAAELLGLNVAHLGPKPEGWKGRYPRTWRSYLGVTDQILARLYQESRWVSGLRHVEGFEMPVIEGLACGARPIVFNRPDMRYWYEGHAVFISECSGVELVDQLCSVLSEMPRSVSKEERDVVLKKFNWKSIVEGFWSAVQSRHSKQVSV